MSASRAPESLARLRRRIAAIEALPPKSPTSAGSIPLGAGMIDAALGGGIARAALHEAAGADGNTGGLIGFALGLAARASLGGAPVLWVQHGLAALEAGGLYGPGLAAFGLPMERLLVLRAKRRIDALWAMEEGLKSPALSVLVGEFADGRGIDLTVTRRLALAARESGGLGLLLLHRASDEASAAQTRWTVTSAPSVPRDTFGGIGRTAIALHLTRNRHGPIGRWILLWDAHARAFVETHPRDLAPAALDRPGRGHVA